MRLNLILLSLQMSSIDQVNYGPEAHER